jgi:hypothetical protein
MAFLSLDIARKPFHARFLPWAYPGLESLEYIHANRGKLYQRVVLHS